MVESLIASTILTLQSHYKDYTRKTFYNFINTIKPNLCIYDNTIRYSTILKDEEYKIIYKFLAEDYKHVPAHRGIIINLFAIAKSLYIHTQHSLFKYSSNNNLTTNDNNEVTVSNHEILENSISEIYDSSVGFAGIAKKEHSVVGFEYYIFYDKYVNKIYAYGGEGKLAPISNNIQKILDEYKADEILFANDENNNRVLINLRKIINDNDTNICLSFNTQFNTFVSVHDIDFVDSFYSRTTSYLCNKRAAIVFGQDTVLYINAPYKINDNSSFFTSSNNTTGNLIKKNYITKSCIDDLGVKTSWIDVICNSNYEKVKTLNYIKWICRALDSFSLSVSTVSLSEQSIKEYGGSNIRIYTDSTFTELLTLIDGNGDPIISNDINNHELILNGNVNNQFNEYPRNNKGIWTWNYFRDVKNISDEFLYRNEPSLTDIQNPFDITPYEQRKKLNHDSSLIYGKYFVVRLMFDRNFKFENIILNMSNNE